MNNAIIRRIAEAADIQIRAFIVMKILINGSGFNKWRSFYSGIPFVK